MTDIQMIIAMMALSTAGIAFFIKRQDVKFTQFDERFDKLETHLKEIKSNVMDLNVRVTIVETRLDERAKSESPSPRAYVRRKPTQIEKK